MRKLIGDELADRLVTFGVRFGGHTLSHALALAGREILNMLHGDNAKGGTVSLENLSQNQRAAIQGVEVKKERIAEFDRFAQKYGLQYTAIEEENDPNMVFLTFRQRDIDKLDMAVTDMLKDKTKSWNDLEDAMQQAKEKAFLLRQAAKEVEQAVREVEPVRLKRESSNAVRWPSWSAHFLLQCQAIF